MRKKELIVLAKKELKYLKDNSFSLANFSFIDRKGNISARLLGGACYASLKTYATVVPYFMMDYEIREKELKHEQKKLKNKAFLEFSKWWIKDSFAHKAFVLKDNKWALKNGIVLNCLLPCRYVMMAALGMRYIEEQPVIIENWYKFSKFIDNNSAFFFAHMFKNTEYGWELRYPGSNKNHSILSNYEGGNKRSVFNAILKNKPCYDNLLPMSESQEYSGFVKLWDSRENLLVYNNNIIFPEEIEMKIHNKRNTWGEPYIVSSYCETDLEELLVKLVDINREDRI